MGCRPDDVPVEKYFKGTDVAYDDGRYILYVNAAVDDGSDTARLMEYFKTTDRRMQARAICQNVSTC